jgi:RNA polymerase sigma-70 factor (ECF subfamily)
LNFDPRRTKVQPADHGKADRKLAPRENYSIASPKFSPTAICPRQKMDENNFHKLILTEVESVHRLAYHLCRNVHEAEDLVQETYLRALRASQSYRISEHGVRPWLFKILHNVLHTRRARDRRARETLQRTREREPMDESTDGKSYPFVHGVDKNAVDTTITGAHWENMDQRLCEAIRLLPLAHRTVFLLAAIEDLKYREIAEVVGVPVGTVMSRISRARAALAAQLTDLAAEQNLLGRRQPDEPREIPAEKNEA